MSGAKLGPTPSQTIGPFFRIGTAWLHRPHLAPEGLDGSVYLSGRVFDGDGAGVPDAVIEVWQAETASFGRYLVDEDGSFAFSLRKGGALDVTVFARGLLNRLVTRVRLADDPAIDSDPILALVPEHRRASLIAEIESPERYRWDVRLQGDAETVFFAW